MPHHIPIAAIEIETPHGPARVHAQQPRAPRAALVLGHGAGGGVGAPDIISAAKVALDESVSVALVEQPYLVAGRRSPAPARQLDAAWLAVVEQLRSEQLAGLPLIVGGRSLGARVACRTVDGTGAIAVLCLAFPVHAPGRTDPADSRLPELDAVTMPTLVVQGTSDPFGMPPPSPTRTVAQVAGDHGLKADLPGVEAAVRSWLRELAA